MRILHIDPDDIDNPLSGGGPRRNFEIYRRLSDKHEITVLTPTFEGSTPEVVRDNVRYVRLGRKIRDHGSSHHITFFFNLPKAIRQFDYDLLVEDFMPPASATLNPLFAKAPVVASVQWFFAEALSKQYKIPFYWGERYGVKLYHNFVVLTRSMQTLITKRVKRAKTTIIPNGLESELFELPSEFDDFILFMGRVDTKQKGIDLLLKAYKQIPKEKRIPLKLAGHSFELAEIKRLIDSLGLTAYVELLGKVMGTERFELMQKCRFMVVPSREETFGMVITEGCAAGKNVVLFDHPPMNEVASSCCTKVPPYDVDRYSDAIETMLERSKSQLLEDSRINRLWASQYSWDQIAQQQDQFYETVVSP